MLTIPALREIVVNVIDGLAKSRHTGENRGLALPLHRKGMD
jgi:hypothetical protein